MSPQSTIARVAESELGVHETSENRGLGIEKYWLATTYPDGMKDRQPWCSAFVSWCVQEADALLQTLSFPLPPRFPAVSQWVPWAKQPEVGADIFLFSDPRYDPRAGDILVLLPVVSHIAIVAKDGWQSGLNAATVEGNSNNNGSRDGVEVVRHLRSQDKYPQAKVIRLPATALELEP